MKDDDVNRLLIGLLVVGGVAGAGFYVWRMYQKEKLKELASPGQQKVITVPVTDAPLVAAKKRKR